MWYSDDPRTEQLTEVAEQYDVPVDALLFAIDLIDTAPQYAGDEPGDAYDMPRHSSAAEVCRAVIPYARALFQNQWREALREMGVKDSSDLGDIVYFLINEGLLQATAEDRREDFDGVCRFLEG